ncbi:MAG: HesA/MoeB/ThiF family protein [Candidatus Amulumruptor sp.]
MPLTEEQKRRYSRNTMLDGIGMDGQQKLLASHVAVVGCGALGSIVSMYLAGAGVGSLTVIDFDTVDISNLQRQLSFATSQCGLKKSAATADRLREINPDITVRSVDRLLTPGNISEIIGTADLIVEGSDNPATKYMVTDYAVATGIPYVMGGVEQWRGQVMSWSQGHRSYRDFFPESAEEGGFTPCALGGVHGPLPGIIGSIMASEAIKIICGCGRPLYDRLFMIDTKEMTTMVINI